LQLDGWLYASPQQFTPNTPLYRCTTVRDHFVSAQATCENGSFEELLGYGNAVK
jgi:hypothetical protein